MSTEIKAKGDSLIEKFRKVGIRSTEEIELHSATQCAIIAVEGIIEAINQAMLYKRAKRDFWNNVLNYLKTKA